MQSQVVLGVDLGGTKVLAAAVNDKGQIVATGRKRTTGVTTRTELLQKILDAVAKAVAAGGLEPQDIAALGIGAPGPVDRSDGTVLEMPNIPVGKLPLRAELQRHYPVPVIVDNDVNAGTFGEFWRGAGRGTRDMVGVFVGTGTGGGVIINGESLRGKTGITGEIGHIVLDPDGPECGCGRRGCLEALASRTAMQRRVEAALREGRTSALLDAAGGDLADLRSKAFAKALKQGDALAEEVIRDCAIHLGYGAVALVHLLSPECIVFGGGVMESLSPVMIPIIEGVVRERCLKGTAKGIGILPAKLGDHAGVLGAAALAMKELGTLSA